MSEVMFYPSSPYAQLLKQAPTEELQRQIIGLRWDIGNGINPRINRILIRSVAWELRERGAAIPEGILQPREEVNGV